MKIPCSVSIITLNVEKELPRCLENLKDFQEIIICDGNSIDGTVAIAERFGAKVIKQYDTDEPETQCSMDKAAVRQRAMDASTLPWRFFMDADDTLSDDSIEEIRKIVSMDNPEHFVYRMPTNVDIESVGRIIHQSSSPGFQTRLVHECVGARFRGNVHEKLEFDQKLFPPGDMQYPYIFHWSEDRYRNFWPFLRTYVAREVQTVRYTSLWPFLRLGIYWRIRAFVGYAWRILKTYFFYGMQGTMPLRIEITILRYHLAILLNTIYKTIFRMFAVRFVVETLKKKDTYRFLSNWSLQDLELYGRVLDIGGGPVRASHYEFFITRRWHRVTTVDIVSASKPDIVADISSDALPLRDDFADTILLMNVLEHVRNIQHTLTEVRRIIKPSGMVYAVIPFFVNVHPDPSDFRRLTAEGLRGVFEDAGLVCKEIRPFGTGPFLAAEYQIEMAFPRIARIFIVPLAMALDGMARIVKPRIATVEKFPLGYTVVAQRA